MEAASLVFKTNSSLLSQQTAQSFAFQTSNKLEAPDSGPSRQKDEKWQDACPQILLLLP